LPSLDSVRWWPLCRSIGHPIAATLACRSGGFRFLVPDLAAPVGCGSVGDFGGFRISPTQWIAMGLETTKEAI